jgi:hypothetical protein
MSEEDERKAHSEEIATAEAPRVRGPLDPKRKKAKPKPATTATEPIDLDEGDPLLAEAPSWLDRQHAEETDRKS